MTENGKVATEVAEQVVEETVEASAELVDRRPWLHPDALMPLDYIRGKTTLADELKERGHSSCYDFLGTDEMYPFVIWALRSRDDSSFTWDDALRTPFYLFRMGDDARPRILPSEKPGRNESTPSGSGSTRRRLRPATAPASSPSSG